MNTATKRGLFPIISIALFLSASATALTVVGQTLRPYPSHFSGASIVRTERVTIAVEGMYCDSCAAGIKAMLKRTPGVISAEISYKEKQAVVDYDSQKTTPEKIVEAINNLGYKASVKNKA